MEKRKIKKFSEAAVVLALSLLALVVFSLSGSGLVWADAASAHNCAALTFGTTATTSTSGLAPSEYTSTNITVSSLSDSYVYSDGSNYALKVGTIDNAGTITFSFDKPYWITKAKVLAYEYSTTEGSVPLSFQTSALSGALTGTVSVTSAPSISDSSIDAGIVFTGLDNSAGSFSTSLTISSGSSTKKRFYLCKIVLTIAVSSGSSSSQALASSSAFSSSSNTVSSSSGSNSPITFNFIEQGDQYSGDCAYIKAGDNDILIDAGNRYNCASTLESFIDDSSRAGDYVSDGKLEYVIATHAHQDHVAGFYGVADSSAAGHNGIFYHYNVGTIIDFPQTDTKTEVYTNYLTARSYAVSQGAQHFTALQCWNNEGNGASRTYQLGNNLTMQILYNYFYDHTPDQASGLNSAFTSSGFSDENDYSVSVLFTQGSKHFLFGGDSEAYAEYSLVKYNSLPTIDLYKADHHGSYTASTDALLSVIQPKLVCVSACVGNQEYASNSSHSFPAQEAIIRIALYTDRVYCTTLGSWTDNAAHAPMNGNIIVSYNAFSNETLTCSNNTTKLKDSAWFKAYRTTPREWT
jgi:beta-lactamase superfamily II metal-dependent hydrolase